VAIDVTPLDFWAPDGNERVKDGENAIAHNALKAQELIAADRADIAAQTATLAGHDVRISSVESAVGVGGGLLMEEPTDPGLYIVGAP
jgi:hypothetical protein